MTKEVSDPLYSGDEISIADIACKLWNGRGFIVFLTLIGGLFGGGAAAFLSAANQPVMSYYIALDGLRNGNYPNDTAFSPQDLLNPAVFAEAAERNEVTDLVRLRKSITVEQSSIASQGIIEKYQQQLSQRGLSVAQIDEINQRFSEELSGDINDNLRLAINYRAIGLDQAAATSFLISLPQIWSEVYRKRFTTIPDPTLQPVTKLPDRKPGFNLSVVPLAGALDRVSSGLNTIITDSRLRSLTTDEGYTAASLQAELRAFREIYLSTLVAREIKDDLPEATAYVESRRLAVEQWNERLAGLRQSISNIQSVMSGDTASRSIENADLGIQVDGTALSSIVSLTNKTGLAEYLTDLSEREQDLVELKSVAKRELNSFVRARPAPTNQLANLKTQADNIIEQYNNLYGRALFVLDAEYPRFFSPISSPQKNSGYIYPLFLQILVGGTVIGFVLGVVLALVRRSGVAVPPGPS